MTTEFKPAEGVTWPLTVKGWRARVWGPACSALRFGESVEIHSYEPDDVRVVQPCLGEPPRTFRWFDGEMHSCLSGPPLGSLASLTAYRELRDIALGVGFEATPSPDPTALGFKADGILVLVAIGWVDVDRDDVEGDLLSSSRALLTFVGFPTSTSPAELVVSDAAAAKLAALQSRLPKLAASLA